MAAVEKAVGSCRARIPPPTLAAMSGMPASTSVILPRLATPPANEPRAKEKVTPRQLGLVLKTIAPRPSALTEYVPVKGRLEPRPASLLLIESHLPLVILPVPSATKLPAKLKTPS